MAIHTQPTLVAITPAADAVADILVVVNVSLTMMPKDPAISPVTVKEAFRHAVGKAIGNVTFMLFADVPEEEVLPH
jgi:Asp-tRNA(Asn)/Glu-tRNA(Gln) amidotransferase A subunit family amidase